MALSPDDLQITDREIELVDLIERIIDSNLRRDFVLYPTSEGLIMKDEAFKRIRENQDDVSFARILACLRRRYLGAGWTDFGYLKSSDSFDLIR